MPLVNFVARHGAKIVCIFRLAKPPGVLGRGPTIRRMTTLTVASGRVCVEIVCTVV